MRGRQARKWLGTLVCAIVASTAGGGPAAAQSNPRTHVLIISGVGGDSARSDRFMRLALDASAALRTRFGIPDEHITLLAEYPAREPRIVRDRATRDAVRTALTRIAGQADATDRVLILFIGHGSSQSGRSQLALVGPDLSAQDFAALLAPIRANPVAVVLAASASGDFVRALSAPGRVIISATKSGAEQNESLFGDHFVTALGSDAADANKDSRVSLLELFTYARREVAREYENSNRMLTEHAILDDDGDGTGRGDPAASGSDGALAAKTTMARAGTVVASDDPRAAPFLRRREAVERQIDSLRAQRERLSAAEYDRRLEDLVVQLAQINRALRDTLARRP